MTHYLIIGTGAAGVSAAEAIRSQDSQGTITLVGAEVEGYYSRPGLAYLLTGEIPESQLFPFQPKDFQNLNVKRIHAQAIDINPAVKKVKFQNGKTLLYDRLLIATGATSRPYSIPGSDLDGVVNLDSLADARQIIRLSRRAKAACVVGGGITSLEIVEGLHAQGIHVHYLMRGTQYWRDVLDETESQIVENRLKEDGIQIHYQTELAEIVGKTSGLFRKGNPQVYKVITKNGQEIRCDIVGVAIGVIPRLELAKTAGIEVKQGVLVNPCMETSVFGIYAAGDVAQVVDPINGAGKMDVLWGTARLQGYVAGLNMAGYQIDYRSRTPLNVTRLAGITTTLVGSVGIRNQDDDLIGIARGDSETWREIPDAIAAQNAFDINRIRLMIGESTLLGGVVMGDQTLSQAIQILIDKQVDISPIREALLSPGNDISSIISDFWTRYRAEVVK